MHAAEPLAAQAADLVLAVAEHGLPARRVEDAVAVDVPVPEAVVGAAHRERVALLGLGEALQRALVRDRVADRVLQPVRREAGDEQEVGDPGLRGLLVGSAVGGVREHDHRHLRDRAHELRGEHQPVGAGRVDLAIDEHDVVARGARARRAPASGVVTCSTSAAAQQRAHRRVAGVVGGDGEDAERAHAASCPGRQLGRLEPVRGEDLHQPHERQERDRLDDVRVRARLVGRRDRLRVVVGAERDDRDAPRARVLLERA